MAAKPKKHLSSAQIILFGFLGVILLGALLLMLPISSKSGNITPFLDAFFTSTSATCVTGLVVKDTATYWSEFGQFIILLLIQIGGLGVVTIAVSLAVLSGKKIGLMQRSTMQESISAPKIGGMVKLTGFILKGTFLIELLGALCLMPVFIGSFGKKGIWMSFFHSVSAFCNAGFDLMGGVEKFSSLTTYAGSGVVNIVIMTLIVVGGIGFLVWEDIKTNKWKIKRYKMQSKVVLITTAILIILPFIYFYFVEYSSESGGRRFLVSLFQAVTPRTAGFNTADYSAMSETGRTITILLMLIGGSPGSTAGGMKTTTVAILMFSAVSVFRRKNDIECFGRRVSEDSIKNAAAILLMYLVLFVGGGLLINALENVPVGICFFETASAIGTVGLSMGLTPTLGAASKVVLAVLMFFGRVGGLTVIFATLTPKNRNLSKKPMEKITVG